MYNQIIQNTNLNKCVQNFYVEFKENKPINTLVNCALFCYDENWDNNSKKCLMFKTHVFTLIKDNLFKIEFWNHNQPLHLDYLNENYKILFHCPEAKNFFYIENTNDDSKHDLFWYKNYLNQYKAIRICFGRWCHAFSNFFDINDITDLNILRIHKPILEHYFKNLTFNKNILNNEIMEPMEPDKSNLEYLFKTINNMSISTNDACKHYIDKNNFNIYSFSYTREKWYNVYNYDYYFNLFIKRGKRWGQNLT